MRRPVEKRKRGQRLSHLQLLVIVLGRVLAALALPTQFLQLSLTFLQALAFALVLHLVLLQSRLQETKHTQILAYTKFFGVTHA